MASCLLVGCQKDLESPSPTTALQQKRKFEEVSLEDARAYYRQEKATTNIVTGNSFNFNTDVYWSRARTINNTNGSPMLVAPVTRQILKNANRGSVFYVFYRRPNGQTEARLAILYSEKNYARSNNYIYTPQTYTGGLLYFHLDGRYDYAAFIKNGTNFNIIPGITRLVPTRP